MTDGLDVLLVEPYHGGSHAAWAEGYVRHSRHRVRLVTHEDAFWRWRMRGAALTLADAVEDDVSRHGRPDVVLVSDMVDVAALLGFARRRLGDTPVALYLHENQLLYPPPPGARDADRRRAATARDEFGLRNWLSMAVVDRVLVNSRYHRDALLGELDRFLRGAPDHGHHDRLDDVATRTAVLPVGVELDDLIRASRRPVGDETPLVVWNQRWEYDKAPEVFLAVIRRLAARGIPFLLALAGENVRTDPREFDAAIEELGDRVVHVGFLPRPDYVALLGRADVIVSTAIHEFFGIAAVEAMAAGAVPLLPDRLSYPELVPPELHPAVLYGDDELEDRLSAILVDLPSARSRVEGLRSAMARFSWTELAPRYDAELVSLVEEYGRRP